MNITCLWNAPVILAAIDSTWVLWFSIFYIVYICVLICVKFFCALTIKHVFNWKMLIWFSQMIPTLKSWGTKKNMCELFVFSFPGMFLSVVFCSCPQSFVFYIFFSTLWQMGIFTWYFIRESEWQFNPRSKLELDLVVNLLIRI